MKVAIILHQPYPYGMACTNRIHLYAKGIKELGGAARIFIPRPTEYDVTFSRNRLARGWHEGIEYQYTCGTPFRAETFLQRRLCEFKGYFSLSYLLVRERKKIDTVLLVSNTAFLILYFWVLTAILGMVYLQEKSELPFYNRAPKNFVSKVYQYLYNRYIYKCFHGILAISQPLFDYFKQRIRRNASLLLVPVMVDTDEFNIVTERKSGASIVYCGNFTQSQDGILTLVEAFKSVTERFGQVSLYLVGDTASKVDKEKVLRLLRDLSLEDRVVLTGYVTRERLRELLCHALILVLAKPSSIQAEYCFPSKLAEYLATGNPVVVTKVGVIPSYLRDGDNAFLVQPDSPAALAQKLEFVLSHPELAKQVGLSGRETAMQNFSYKKQAKRIIEFGERIRRTSIDRTMF